MTQESIQITETPPLPGLKLVQDLNKALLTLGTDFAGPDDPAALARPYMTWADTGNMLLKRRNAANTAWVIVAPLLSYGSPSLTFKAAPAVANEDVIVKSQALGVGGTWQNMTASRAFLVTYTNTTGRPIAVQASLSSTAAFVTAVLFVDGVAVWGDTMHLTGYVSTVNAVVPPGANYMLSQLEGGTLTLARWLELR